MDPSYNNSFDSFQNGTGGVISSVPSASAEGRKVRKGPIIAGVILAVAAIALIVWYLITDGVTPMSDVKIRAAKQDPEFGEMMNFIEKGEGFEIEYPKDENGENIVTAVDNGEYNFFYAGEDGAADDEEVIDEESDEDTGEAIDYKYDFIYAIDIYGENYGWVASYYSEVENKITKFEETLEGRVTSATLEGYKEAMKVLRNAVDYETVEQRIIANIGSDGINSARDYIDNQVKCNGSGELAGVCAAEAEYYEAIVDLYERYNGVGCAYVDENEVTYDDECLLSALGEESYNLQMDEMLSIDVNSQNFLDYSSLKAINETVRAYFEQMAKEIVNA